MKKSSDNNKPPKLDIKFMEGISNEEIKKFVDEKVPIMTFEFNLVLSDTVLMFHICLLNKLNEEVTLKNVCDSIRETLKHRLFFCEDDFINTSYQEIVNTKTMDKCLEDFKRIKKELHQKFINDSINDLFDNLTKRLEESESNKNKSDENELKS